MTALALVLALLAGPKVALGGDTMLARLVTEAMEREGPRYVWGDALPLLQGADLTLVNLECCVAEGGEPFVPERVFYFRASPLAIDALELAGVDCVTLANNHALDYRAEGLLETLRRLDDAGIRHVGAGRNLEEASRPAILEAGGLKIGVVGFADHFRLYAAGRTKPGTNVIEIPEDLGRVHRAIRRAHAMGADVVVFTIHWGPNFRTAPTPEFREFARAVLDAGADVFHGHSAHVFQGIEIHEGKPILYDTGDLVDDYRVDPEKRNDLALLFRVEVERKSVKRLELFPLKIGRMRVNRAGRSDFEEIARRMKRLSADLGTGVVAEKDRLVVPLAGP